MAIDGNILVSPTSTYSVALTNRAGNVLGAGSLTLLQNASDDDAFIAITLPFSVNFNGVLYSTVYVGSNGYLTFGGGSYEYSGLGASNPPFPAIHINASDRSYQRVYGGVENSGATFRLRYEGASGTSGTPGASTVFWEVTFTAATPTLFKIDIGDNAAAGTGTSGVSNGTAYLATFGAGTANTGYDLQFSFDGTPFTVAGKLVAPGVYDGAAALPLALLDATTVPSNPMDTVGDGAAQLAPWSLAAAGQAQNLLDGAVELTPWSSAAGTLAGTSASADVTLAMLVLDAAAGTDGAVVLLPAQLDATGLAGSTGGAALSLSPWLLAAALRQDGFADAAIVLSPPQLAATASGAGAAAAGAILLPPAQLDALAAAGSLGQGAILLPELLLAGVSWQDASASASLMLPLFAVAGTAGGPAASVYSTLALNTRTGAVTTYAGTPLNSLCTFNGVVLAATPDGIVALTGDTDLGSPIAASMTSGQLDFGSPQHKRLAAAYVGYRAGGDLELSLAVDEGAPAIYRLAARETGLHPTRSLLGRGARGRYWQWQLANVGGAAFEIDALAFDAEVLARRI